MLRVSQKKYTATRRLIAAVKISCSFLPQTDDARSDLRILLADEHYIDCPWAAATLLG